MVDKNTINDIIEGILNSNKEFIVKCPKGYISPKTLLNRFNKNHDSFQKEEYSPDQDWKAEHPDEVLGWDSPIGKLQKVQENLQEQIEYDWWDKQVVQGYSKSDFLPVNKYLNKSEGWIKEVYYPRHDENNEPYYIEDENYLQHEIYLANPWTNINDGEPRLISVPECSDILSSVIDKSPRLQQDTIFYRWGEFPSDLKAGDKGVFKGFSSTSFNPTVAEQIGKTVGTHWMKDNRMMIRIFAPAGTKGVVPSEQFLTEDWQSEFLLDKNQKYIVIGVKDGVADILLY